MKFFECHQQKPQIRGTSQSQTPMTYLEDQISVPVRESKSCCVKCVVTLNDSRDKLQPMRAQDAEGQRVMHYELYSDLPTLKVTIAIVSFKQTNPKKSEPWLFFYGYINQNCRLRYLTSWKCFRLVVSQHVMMFLKFGKLHCWWEKHKYTKQQNKPKSAGYKLILNVCEWILLLSHKSQCLKSLTHMVLLSQLCYSCSSTLIVAMWKFGLRCSTFEVPQQKHKE